MSSELIVVMMKGALMALSLSLVGLLLFYVLNIIKKVLFKAKKTVTPLSKAVYNHSKDIVNDIKPAINEYKEKHSITKTENEMTQSLNSEINEDEIYEDIMIEIEQDNKVKSTWAKALSQSDGNKDKAESLYISMRFEELKYQQSYQKEESYQNENIETNNEVEIVKNSSSKKIVFSIVLISALITIGVPVFMIMYYNNNSNKNSSTTASETLSKESTYSAKVQNNTTSNENLNTNYKAEKQDYTNKTSSQQFSEYKDWKIDNHVGDYYLGDTTTQLIYIEEINPFNKKIEEGKQYITNIVKLDLTNNNKVTLLNGCSKPSYRGDGCVYSNPILINDDTTLYYQKDQWIVTDGIYKLDLVTLENKFITDGNEFKIINEGKYKNFLVVNKHKYLKDGGSYDSNFLISPEGKEISAVTSPESYSYYKSKSINQNNGFMNLVQNLIYEWDKAHNNKDINTFNLMYDENLNYYNKKDIKKSLIIEDKKRLLNKFLNFYQSSKILKIENLEKNIYKINYEKNVIYGEQKKTFFSYLIIKIINDKPIIIEEND